MFSNLSLYYLQQMGITPWIIKEKNLLNTEKNCYPNKPSLVILSTPIIDKNAEILFKKIITFIDNTEATVQINYINDTNALNTAIEHIKEQSPIALLLFGVPSEQLLTATKTCPAFTLVSLDELLSNPAAKKKVFHELHTIKELLLN